MSKMSLDSQTAVYRQQIEASEPTLNIQTWEINREGLVNNAVIVNETHVFRFPKHEWAIDHLWQEANCLTLAHEHLDMPLPRWTVYDGEIVGTPFVGYEWIPGKPLQRFEIMQLSESDQDGLAEQLSTFLLQMHTIPVETVKEVKIGRSVTVRTQEDWLKMYETVQEKLFPHLMAFQKEWVHQHFAPVIESPAFIACEQTFINGDLGPYHLLYNPETRRLNGIIDFGTAGMGDPANDFAVC